MDVEFSPGLAGGEKGLAEELSLRLEAVAELAGRLEQEGLLLQVVRPGSEDVGFTLALPPERIPLSRIASLASRCTLGERPRVFDLVAFCVFSAADRHAYDKVTATGGNEV